ncbi:DNA sulfur modification protein DndD [uncultured Williamsia sp.]|uniref:DNA sulfur modification protein DndD n=1 Tax=uncultured Williamsia sp. TaxID=259311 RepID=UPI002634251F|nr:DNA sulfur modification protein DndD [uncultured Williamsia sp.]
MILNELVLHNVGTFAGRQAIDLTPPSAAKPIVLVGGLNGAGKTTILEAIQLALYGSLAHQAGRRAGSYEKYIRGLIHRGVPASEGAAVELTFTAHQEGQEHTYWIRRSWKSESFREILLVSVDGRHHPSLASTWNEHVETFLPRGITGLFFFDGEQIEALADLDRSRQVLASALAALLGLDLVERLATDLSVLKRRHRGEHVPEGLRQEVEEKMQAVTLSRQSEETAAQAERDRHSDLERAKKLFHEATEAYRAAGGELLEQRESAEAKSAMVRASLTQCEDDIRHELSEVSPLLQLDELMLQLANQARDEEVARQNAALIHELASRDDAVVQELQGADVNSKAIATIREYFEADRLRREASASISEVGDLVSYAVVDGLRSGSIPEARRRLQLAIDRRSALKTDLDQAERVLVAIPDPEALAPLLRVREATRDGLRKAEAAADLATGVAGIARSERIKRAEAYEAALDKAAHANFAADDDRRLVDHVDRVRQTLEGLRVAATTRHLERISSLVLEALGMLLRKQQLVTEVRIDPYDYTVSLTGADGHALPAKDLSAGERQLLAVALLWGLARASGQPLPVVIDTPLGRLDSSHRGHLMDRYFPHASHQVVLLSTDTEIDEDAYRRIAPKVGRSYHLKFDGDRNATTVRDGYFWEQ